ncbi:MAG TPA: hypothetical protein VKV16_10475 [Solirubrobacteraceae bacterium]|nr:hypothetical protein [Solirubrobacteraceae bacterium]
MPGLLRWTAAHPDWRADAEPGGSDDWGQMVGCGLYELVDRVVLIDPLLPDAPRRREFLRWLDERVAGRAVSILTTIRWHRRDRAELAERYARNGSRPWNYVPPGVEQRPLRGAGETLFWLPAVATLVCGDRVIGAEGPGAGRELRVCPQSWLSQVRADRREVAALLRPLLALAIERVLVSHGEPVLRAGHAALARAIAEAQDAEQR